jgi:hypothetical protein
MSEESRTRNRLDQLNERWIELARRGELHAAWHVSDEALALRAGIDCSGWPRHHQFIWRGQQLRGQRVLVRCYHGLGDTIHFVRFVPELRKIAREVILWTQPALIPLLRTLDGGPDRIIPLTDGSPEVEFDVDIELTELMHALRATPAMPRIRSPYLLAREPRRARPPRGAMQVGLVWRSGEWNATRSVACELLAPLGDIDGIEWLLFQRGPALSEWRHAFGRVPRIDGPLDEARQMLELDLLISVDTCSAHLGGAVGAQVWTLLPADADWRWMRDQAVSSWYPTMHLFRQHTAGDWSSVIDEAAKVLRAACRSREGRAEARRIATASADLSQ